MKAADYRTTMTEDALLATVKAMAKQLGWLVYHTHDSRRSDAGLPDIIAVRKGVLIFAELKREGQKPTPAQNEWIGALATVQAEAEHWVSDVPKPFVDRPVRVYVWRPSDLADIERILR